MFRNSVQQQRCVIPSAGFYEWDKQKQKYLFWLPGKKELYMAGIYEEREGKAYYCILTAAANGSMKEIHDRMPLVLTQAQADAWLQDAGEAGKILHGVPPELDRTPAGEQMGL